VISPIQAFLGDLYAGLGGGRGIAAARGGARLYALAAHLSQCPGPAVVVVAGEAEGRRLREGLAALLGDRAAPPWLPAPDADPYEGLPDHPGILLERSLALTRAATASKPSLLTSVASLLVRVPKRGWWGSQLLLLEEGGTLDRRALRAALWRHGYRKVEQAGEPGEAAFRGGIVDLFPPTESLPVRAELFGEEVESLRFFDPASQRSLSAVGRPVLLPPLTEAVRDEELLERLRVSLAGTGEFGEIRLDGLQQVGTYPTLSAEVRQDEAFFGGLAEFVGEAGWILVDPPALARRAVAALEEWRESHRRHARPPFLHPDRLFLPAGVLDGIAARPSTLLLGEEGEGLPAQRPPLFPGDPLALIRHVKEQVKQGFRCLALLQGKGTLQRLSEMALAEDLVFLQEAPQGSVPPGFYAALAPLEEGLVLPTLRWMVITEKEIFGRGKALPEARIQRREAFFTGLRDLKEGDFVVHVEHGVGRYRGIETLVRQERREDFLVLQYAGADRLLVPVQRMDLVQRYVGPEGHRPPLDRLGSPAWKKAKDKVRKAVKEMAGDLLALYAQRRTAEGVACGPDTQWQAEFEAQFPFELTEGQQAAIADVKADMEAPKPMDRLVCGDVGFGKTEVAMRAAFKAVQEGRQVLVLCPTTVLALQHLERFRERFAPFPVKVAMLSRFIPPREQKRLVSETNAGQIDILVGTHRLLSKDLRPPALGLLVVDEEQRFGVAHKERIKQMKTQVDVLTLTATPIPRTLQMGLSGILDMSLIQTPPKDRLSIQTTVHPYDEELIQSAIRRELARGGQVYLVHNQVESIAAAAKRILALVPEARVTVAHGQMGERALEEVMLAFFHGHYDVLVCTTIIESGVDLPRVNTLLVENAHRFGLSQLYQLRGRIGRSDVPSYAYLLTPPGVVLDEEAQKRLVTLQEFSELGAGFRVAAVDLELRGAGNLLGAEQSGHMAAVGFELYLRMLEEAVSEAKGEPLAPVLRCEMNLGLDLSVPVEYMEDMNQRLAFYREVSLALTEAEVERVASSARDRFGPLPPRVSRMLDAVKLRLKAESLQVRSVSLKPGRLSLAFDPSSPLDTGGLVGFLSRRRGVKLDPGGLLELPLAAGEDALGALRGLLEAASPAKEARA
jgi:transcription-repair coupling factor (superfamily II helicase)